MNYEKLKGIVTPLISDIGNENTQSEMFTYYSALTSLIVTSLRRSEPFLITYPPGSRSSCRDITRLVEYIVISIVPLSFSITDPDGVTTVPAQRRDRTLINSDNRKDPENDADIARIKNQNSQRPSPFSTNVALFQDFKRYRYKDEAIMNIKSVSAYIPEFGQYELPNPFVLIGLCPDNEMMEPDYLRLFSYCFHLTSMPAIIPNPTASLVKSYNVFDEEKLQIYTNRHIDIYISNLFLAFDMLPLSTSYIGVDSKILIKKAAENLAHLLDRDFLIPDDIKCLFPSFVAHRFKLPTPTTFRENFNYAFTVLSKTQTPV